MKKNTMIDPRIKDYIKIYDESLSRDFCKDVISLYNSHPERHIVNGKGKRAGLESSKWTEMDVGQLAIRELQDAILGCIKKYKKQYEKDCNMASLPEPGRYDQLILKKYTMRSDECFEVHFDSLLAVSDRYLVMLWYLNDVYEGGATEFVDLDVSVAPKEGRLLIFPPYWLYRHKGNNPVSNDKYILSTYLLW